ncbi:MAG: transketolase C-terminal domain-containing protein [Planctomycetota bacterium]
MTFPIDMSAFKKVELDFNQTELTAEQEADLTSNIQLCRDAIVFFTACGAARGVSGHTGGPYDTVPEVMIAMGLMNGSDKVLPIFFDEAGHRVATQYLVAALRGHLTFEKLTEYRTANSTLPGHPELGLTPGVQFASGRLGHMWPFVNGIAKSHPGKAVLCFGSDGSQQEGDDAEAARIAVSQKLNVKVIVDDNDVTIAGHPSQYQPGYSVMQTLQGHGLWVDTGPGEDVAGLYTRMAHAVRTDGPIGLVNKRVMGPGLPGVEGSPHAHDVISVDNACTYLDARGHAAAVDYLKAITKPGNPFTFKGSDNANKGATRGEFGKAVADIVSAMDPATRADKVFVIDSDLEGSTGIKAIRDAAPDVYAKSGIMERGNFSMAAGFGFDSKQRQGVFATFSAFLEMIVSEATMARLNFANVLCHFSHAGVDEMADNTCHFGINNMFADNGLEDDHHPVRLYFPCDVHQMRALVNVVFHEHGMRYVFSNRAKQPPILTPDGKPMYGEGYAFVPGKDEVIREGSAGYVVSFGSTVHRALDAVETLKEQGLDVGLINKPSLNVVDEDTMAKLGKAPFVLVAEEFNRKTGLGVRFGSWLMERGYTPKYRYLGVTKEGCGGLWEQMPYQGLGPDGIADAVRQLAN